MLVRLSCIWFVCWLVCVLSCVGCCSCVVGVLCFSFGWCWLCCSVRDFVGGWLLVVGCCCVVLVLFFVCGWLCVGLLVFLLGGGLCCVGLSDFLCWCVVAGVLLICRRFCGCAVSGSW